MELKTTPARHDSNSYISLTDAESYFSSYNRLAKSETWPFLTEAQQKFALFLAAKALDTFSFRGQQVTHTQNRAFPRLSWYQINVEKETPWESFFKATRPTELTSIVDSGDIEVSNNKLADTSSSGDAFYNPYFYEKIDINQVIKVTGLSTDEYLTIKDIAFDGSYIEIKEDIADESVPTGGVDIDATPLFGFSEEIGYAQAELAFQYVDTNVFQANINEIPEPALKSWTMGNNIEVTYQNNFWGFSKFSPERVTSLDIVYMLLGDWITSVGGGVV